MVLGESACFIDPEGVAILSATTVGRETDSYPGMVWVGLKATRIIGLIPEKRAQIFLDAATAKFTREELAAAAKQEAESGVPAAVTGPLPSGVPVAGGVPGLGPGGYGLPTVQSASIFAGHRS